MSTNQHLSDNIESDNLGSHHELVPSSDELTTAQSLAEIGRAHV